MNEEIDNDDSSDSLDNESSPLRVEKRRGEGQSRSGRPRKVAQSIKK